MAHLELLQSRFSDAGLAFSRFRDNDRVLVPAGPPCGSDDLPGNDGGFDMLVDVTCVDYLEYENADDRYGVVYCLLNTVTGERVIVKTFVNDPDPALPSMYPLWKSADWTGAGSL